MFIGYMSSSLLHAAHVICILYSISLPDMYILVLLNWLVVVCQCNVWFFVQLVGHILYLSCVFQANSLRKILDLLYNLSQFIVDQANRTTSFANLRLLRYTSFIFIPLSFQFRRLKEPASYQGNQLGRPCRTPLLILIFSLLSCSRIYIVAFL